MSLNGIDISSHQAGINISKLTTTDFVIVKATQGTTYVNPCFEKHYNEAKKAGKLLGTYHYFGGNDPVKEADFYIKTVGKRVGEGILVLDWEGYQNSSFAKGPSVAWKFLQRVHDKTGIWPMIYMSKSVTRSYNWSTVAKYCGLWVAQYANSNRTNYQSKPWTDSKGTGAWPTVAIHQYSSKGKITGYTPTIDINIAYLSDGSWKLYANPRKQEQPVSSKVVDYFPGPDDNAKYICMAYQEVLAGRGYYKGAIDGYWGPKSIAAAKALQKKFGMDENGIMNEETVLALFGWRV